MRMTIGTECFGCSIVLADNKNMKMVEYSCLNVKSPKATNEHFQTPYTGEG